MEVRSAGHRVIGVRRARGGECGIWEGKQFENSDLKFRKGKKREMERHQALSTGHSGRKKVLRI